MVGLIALTICLFVIWQLFRLTREKDVQVSTALWIPTFWLFIASSRNISAWFQFSPSNLSDQYIEGSPVDRAVLTALLALGVVVLLGRARKAGVLLASNIPILLYFLYCGISVVWSDFPDVAFKRWFRALGDVVMVLIVLSDPNWLAALRRLLARVGFVVVPLSIVFIRYYPQLGRTYTQAGNATWTGVATDKNGLGMICLVFGMAFIFRFLQIYRGKEATRQTGPLIAYAAAIVMALYLLYEVNSATAFSCFFLASLPMVLTYLYRGARQPAVANLMVFAALGIAVSVLFLNIGSGVLSELGRNSTLTGRTNVWRYALGMVRNPVFGTGFESFWLGPRLDEMKVLLNQGINQAHNGYIEVFLNLGWMGVALLIGMLIAGYRRILVAVRGMTQAGSLRLGYFVVAVAYNFTEAGFKMMHPVWIAFLLATMVVPEVPPVEDRPALDVPRADSLAARRLETARPTVQVWKAHRAT